MSEGLDHGNGIRIEQSPCQREMREMRAKPESGRFLFICPIKTSRDKKLNHQEDLLYVTTDCI